jgi:hypothetical protein
MNEYSRSFLEFQTKMSSNLIRSKDMTLIDKLQITEQERKKFHNPIEYDLQKIKFDFGGPRPIKARNNSRRDPLSTFRVESSAVTARTTFMNNTSPSESPPRTSSPKIISLRQDSAQRIRKRIEEQKSRVDYRNNSGLSLTRGYPDNSLSETNQNIQSAVTKFRDERN